MLFMKDVLEIENKEVEVYYWCKRNGTFLLLRVILTTCLTYVKKTLGFPQGIIKRFTRTDRTANHPL